MEIIDSIQKAGILLYETGVVNDDTTVEGRDLIEVCGFDVVREAQSIKRQIEKHSFSEGEDYTSKTIKSSGGRPKTEYHFSFRAACLMVLRRELAPSSINRFEHGALAAVEQLTGVNLVRQYSVLGYRIDGYDPVSNIAYEVDEPHHYVNGSLREEDIKRQREIEKELGCTFVRIRIPN